MELYKHVKAAYGSDIHEWINELESLGIEPPISDAEIQEWINAIKNHSAVINGTSLDDEPPSLAATGSSTTIKVYGVVRNSPSPFSESSGSYIDDVSVCAWD
jgi:hypothetical protein